MFDDWVMTDEFPGWLLQEYLGEDDEEMPIIWDADVGCYWVGDDEDGNPIFVEMP
jgi:hypothetical protein